MQPREKTRLVSRVIVLGFVAAVLWHGWHAVAGHPYPQNTFLYAPWLRFSDFFDVYDRSAGLDPYSGWAIYFPFAYVVGYVFTLLPAEVGCLVYSIAIAIFVLLFFLFHLERAGIPALRGLGAAIALSLLTYPLLLLLDRANLEGLLFAAMAVALETLRSGRPGRAALLLAPPIAMKLHPVVLGVLFTTRSRRGWILVCGVLVVTLSAASIALFRTPIDTTWSNYTHQMEELHEHYVIGERGLGHASGLYGGLKVVSFLVIGKTFPGDPELLHAAYVIGGAVLLLAIAFHASFVERQLWKRVTLAVVAIILLPTVSSDYKLVHLFLPLAYFLRAAPENRRDDLLVSLIFALLLVPKAYAYVPHLRSDNGTSDIGMSVIVNPLLLILLAVVVARSGLRKARWPLVMARARLFLTVGRRRRRG